MGRAVRWKFAGRRTREERRAQRRDVVLKDAGITLKTQQRYFLGLQKLLPHLQGINTALDLDEQVAQWIQLSWEDGESIRIISDGMCGLHHYEPWTKRMLPQSWKLFSVWRKLEGPDRAPPLTRHIVYSFCNYGIDHSDIVFSALLALGFFALLRTGEILQVKPCDVLLSDEHGIVSLFNTKSGQRDNVAEMVMFDDFLALELVRAAISLRQSQGLFNVPFWTKSAQSFRDTFGKYCQRFDLCQHQFRPYSLRRGGATWLFQTTGSMEVALLKGRWSSSRVARIYISDALSYLPGLTYTKKASSLLQRWSPFCQPD